MENNTNTRMYWLQTITPLHVGSGKGVGFIDMPIMREKVTDWPLVPGSAVKGVLRDHFKNGEDAEQKRLIEVAFGKKDSNDNSNAGSLILTDAHIVFLPVRSLYGTFAYVTCPLVLERLRRDLDAAGYVDFPATSSQKRDEVLISADSKIAYDNSVFFEDLDFKAKVDETATKWAKMLGEIIFPKEMPKETFWRTIFSERIAILSDDCFNFLSKTATEVSAHIRIKEETKTVDDGALWYEETLPSEAILAGIAWCDRVFGAEKPAEKTGTENAEKTNDKKIDQSHILETYCTPAKQNPAKLSLQMGGKATVGKGHVKCLFTRS